MATHRVIVAARDRAVVRALVRLQAEVDEGAACPVLAAVGVEVVCQSEVDLVAVLVCPVGPTEVAGAEVVCQTAAVVVTSVDRLRPVMRHLRIDLHRVVPAFAEV